MAKKRKSAVEPPVPAEVAQVPKVERIGHRAAKSLRTTPQVPLPILLKIAGNSRIQMTIYYTKLGDTQIRQAIEEDQRQIENGKEY